MFQTVLQAGQAPPSNHTLSIWCKKIIMATHRRPGYEPPFMTGDGLEMVHFGTRIAKGLSTFQSGQKGTKMVNPSVFDHFGPFWAYLNPSGPF